MHGGAARRRIKHGGLCAALAAGEAAHSRVMGDPTPATLHAGHHGILPISYEEARAIQRELRRRSCGNPTRGQVCQGVGVRTHIHSLSGWLASRLWALMTGTVLHVPTYLIAAAGSRPACSMLCRRQRDLAAGAAPA